MNDLDNPLPTADASSIPDAEAPPHDPFADFRRMAEEGMKDAKARWGHLWTQAESIIKEHPGKAMLLALGLGMLVGMAVKDSGNAEATN
jgi:hypothetical protein